MESKLFVGNLSFNAAEEDITDFFTNAGYAPVEVKVIRDRDTGGSRGFAFVEFGDVEIAKGALENLSNQDLLGRSMKIDYAQPQGSNGGARREGGREKKGRKGDRW